MEASQECRLRLSVDRPPPHGKERQRFKVGVRGSIVKARSGQRGVGGECGAPAGPAGSAPRLISARPGPAASVPLSVQRADREAHTLRAQAPPASVGSEVVRKVGEGAGLGSCH